MSGQRGSGLENRWSETTCRCNSCVQRLSQRCGEFCHLNPYVFGSESLQINDLRAFSIVCDKCTRNIKKMQNKGKRKAKDGMNESIMFVVGFFAGIVSIFLLQLNKVNKSKRAHENAVEHPKHYNIPGRKECIVEMLELFGVEKVKAFCELNAYKYRYRHELKNGEEDLKKAEWYENKLAELNK